MENVESLTLLWVSRYTLQREPTAVLGKWVPYTVSPMSVGLDTLVKEASIKQFFKTSLPL